MTYACVRACMHYTDECMYACIFPAIRDPCRLVCTCAFVHLCMFACVCVYVCVCARACVGVYRRAGEGDGEGLSETV